MNCCFCGKYVETIEQAIELGRYPDFWCGDVNTRAGLRRVPEALSRHGPKAECTS